MMDYAERTEQVAKTFLALLNDINDINAELLERMTLCDRKTQDVLHAIEFSRFSACQGDKFARQLKEIREARRDAKNQRELIAYFKKFADDHKNMPIAFTNILHSMKQMRQAQDNRQYKPREPEIFESA